MIRPTLAILPMLVFVTACSHMPVTSMIKLARADWQNTDPGQLRAAVKLPTALRLKPNGVMLRVGVRIGAGPEEIEEFVLREVSDPNDVLALHAELEANTHIVAYRLDATEAARFAAFRDALKRKKELAGGRGGAVSISLRPDACRIGELPPRPLYVTTYLKTAETEGYVPLLRDLDLRNAMAGRDVVAEIPLCA